MSPQHTLLTLGNTGGCEGDLGQHGAAHRLLNSSFFPHSPVCPQMWDPAHIRGCAGHWAPFLRPCLCPGGTWTSCIPSCGREKGSEPSLPRVPHRGVLDAEFQAPCLQTGSLSPTLSPPPPPYQPHSPHPCHTSSLCPCHFWVSPRPCQPHTHTGLTSCHSPATEDPCHGELIQRMNHDDHQNSTCTALEQCGW